LAPERDSPIPDGSSRCKRIHLPGLSVGDGVEA